MSVKSRRYLLRVRVKAESEGPEVQREPMNFFTAWMK